MDIKQIVKEMVPDSPKTIAVAGADDDILLLAIERAREQRIAKAILCGDPEKIEATAKKCGVDLTPYEIAATKPEEAAQKAVQLVRNGQAEVLMKGLVQTADLLREVLNKEYGLRGRKVLSHVSILHAPKLMRPVLLTDSAMVMYPDLKTKVQLIENANLVARGIGITCPKVAPIAAVEVVNPEMPATVDAAQLTIMNRRGQIRDCLIDGPLSLDLALSLEAVKHKRIESEVAGAADILLMPNIEAANASVKVFSQVANSLVGGLIIGANSPIVLTSRAESADSKLYSIACAVRIV